MHRSLTVFLAFLIAASSAAADSCAVRASKRLATGQVVELATWFASPSPALTESLAALASQLGTVTSVTESKQPLSGTTTRRSVVSAGLPTQYTFGATWAGAQSSQLGRIQVQAAVAPGPGCKLLALHVDTPL